MRRLIFVRTRRKASLAPIYAALVFLPCVGLLALAYAFWQEGSSPSALQPSVNKVVPATGSPERNRSFPRRDLLPPGRGRWA
jgi:hypothetical protein